MTGRIRTRRRIPRENVTRELVLGWLYDIAHIPGYLVTSLNVDEPNGMDSDWLHLEGDLTTGVDRDAFVAAYRDLDLEWASTSGILLGWYFMVGFSLPRAEVVMTYPEAAPREVIDRMLVAIESICAQLM